MAVTLIVETGSLVANANSFVTQAEVVSYCNNRGYTFDVSDSDAANRAIIKGGDYLKNVRRLWYRGSLRTATQTMPWPREGASYWRGPAIDIDFIPQCVKDAQCEASYRAKAGTNLQPDLDHGGRVKLEKVDVIEEEFFPDASPETVITAIMGILEPVLLDQRFLPAYPYTSANPVDNPPFQTDEFADPPAAYDTAPPATS